MDPSIVERSIPIGAPHRALATVALLIYEYDALGVDVRTLRAGATFQPWAPLPQSRGQRVPITLGDGAAQFDWSAASPTARFLWQDDFIERCARADALSPQAMSRRTESPIASPFAELDAIGARLRSAATTAADRAMVDDALAKLATIHAAHTSAAEMQRGAEGYDNTESAARYADTQARLLAEAREILRTARALCRGS